MTTRTLRLGQLRERALEFLERFRWVVLLLGRLAVGLVFVSTGWGKVFDIPKVTVYFESLGIPAPGFHAVLVGFSELLCGGAIVVGLFTRLATIPLVVSMIVAILTARRPDLHGLFDLAGFEEFTYLVLLLILSVFGPGAASLDHLLVRRMGEDRGASGTR